MANTDSNDNFKSSEYMKFDDNIKHDEYSDRIENIHSLFVSLGLDPSLDSLNFSILNKAWRAYRDKLIEETGGDNSPLVTWQPPSAESIVDHYLYGEDTPHPIDKSLDDDHVKSYHDGTKMLGFVPGIAPARPRIPGVPLTPRINPLNPDIFTEGVKTAGDYLKGINEFAAAAREGMDALKTTSEEAQKLAEGVGIRIKKDSDVRYPDFGGSGSDIYTDNYASGSLINPRGLSLSTQPIESRLETDIGVTNFPYYYKDGKYNTSPLIFKAFNLFLSLEGSNTDPTLADFLKGSVMTDIRTQVLKGTVYNREALDLLNYSDFSQWWNTLAETLLIYFWFNSILAYQAIPMNRNKGFETIYNAIDPKDLLNLQNLGFELSKQSIPPTLVETCHYLMNNFVQSEMPGSPIIKLMPMAFAKPDQAGQPFTKIKDYGTSDGPVSFALKLLKEDKFIRFNALIGRTFSTWTEPTLGGYTGVPRHDPNFTTMWVNYGYWHAGKNSSGAATALYSPTISDLNSRIQYNYHTDSPDGWTQALFPVQVGSSIMNDISFTYLIDYTIPTNRRKYITSEYDIDTTTTGCKTSCVIFAEFHSVTGFYPIENLSRYQALAGNTYVGVNTNNFVNAYQKFGATAADNTSIIGLNYTTEQFISWLVLNDFNKDSGQRPSSKSSRSMKGSGSKRRRGRGRGKMGDKIEE